MCVGGTKNIDFVKLDVFVRLDVSINFPLFSSFSHYQGGRKLKMLCKISCEFLT